MSESLHRHVPSAWPSAPASGGTLSALVGAKLALVEDEIRRNLRSEFPPIDDAGRYVSEGGGKMIRPTLVLLTSGLVGYKGDLDVLMGAVFEFIHTATLVHDDIIDGAETRRGRPSANQVFGNETTVLFGDYLYIHSMNMALRAGKLRLIEILAEATERMIEGEILGSDLRGRTNVTAAQHLAIVERKTAWLFSACCRVAAVLANLDPAREKALADYGMSLGVAFQLVDDLLDLTADESRLGKPVASDLREGRMTLPWIDLFERGSDRERAAITRIVRGDSFSNADFDALRRALDVHRSLERTREFAVEHATRARAIVESFPASPYRDVLRVLPDLILQRDH